MAETGESGPEILHILVSVTWCILCFQRITFLRTYLTSLQLVIRTVFGGRTSPLPFTIV